VSVLFVSLFAVLYTEACAQLLIKRFSLFVHSLTVGCLVIKIEHVEFSSSSSDCARINFAMFSAADSCFVIRLFPGFMVIAD
jgi:hypothetical protein